MAINNWSIHLNLCQVLLSRSVDHRVKNLGILWSLSQYPIPVTALCIVAYIPTPCPLVN